MNVCLHPRIGYRFARRLWLLTLFGGVLTILLAACGSSSSTSATTPATSGASTSTTAEAASTSTSTSNSATATPEDNDSEYATPAASPATGTPSTGSVQLAIRDDPKLGKFLTGDKGLTLYIYKKDTANTSTCYDTCASNWPPLISSAVPTLPSGAGGTLSLVSRKDGTKQVAYNGMPLYYFIKDAAPGDTAGQDIGDVWYVASVGS